ncbi:MAG TPA: hypothetical protein VEA99_14920 [Gemmatimonadaceae bacterium]|nr:hypothetical protein [Gemmatimonadaceae bacterium]
MSQHALLQGELARACEHWRAAAERLRDPEALAPLGAWRALEHYLGVSLRGSLRAVVARLEALVQDFERQLAMGQEMDAALLQARLAAVRHAYLRAETTVDFYGDALATRTSPRLGAMLRACDHIATRSMAEALTPMGREVPAALTYLDKGLGASILKAGLRLWDGSEESCVAAIKITRHNLLRPNAIVHEAGHQVAHMLGWVPELAARLEHAAGAGELGRLWGSWASEIAADGFAHAHTGFAAAAALHDVLDGTDAAVFQIVPGDPHPVSYLRVWMVLGMCRHSFGAGPWDATGATWCAKHPIARCPAELREVMRASVRVMPRLVSAVLDAPYRAFGGRPITALIDPRRVSPPALEQLARQAGTSAFTSTYWSWNEAVRLMALNGYRAGLGAAELREATAAQERWMLRLGAMQVNKVA